VHLSQINSDGSATDAIPPRHGAKGYGAVPPRHGFVAFSAVLGHHGAIAFSAVSSRNKQNTAIQQHSVHKFDNQKKEQHNTECNE
jgi:hypothetical protein